MLSLIYIVLTFIALFLIPCVFISRRLSVPFSLTNILRFIKITTSKYDDEEERNHKGGTIGKKLVRGRIPKHVGIILDGNRRWASKRGLGTSEGYEAGVSRLRETSKEYFAMGTSEGHKVGVNKLREKAKEYFVTGTSKGHKPEASRLMESAKDCFDMGTTTISLFAFSTENWQRPEDEVNSLMALFEYNLKSEMPYFQRDKIKISVIGNRARIPESLQGIIREAEEATKSFEGKHLIIAIDYSGRLDILQACKSLAKKARDGLIEVEDINEEAMEKELMTKCSEFPNPDLLIRTSGEQRISNFFLWQSAYTELYFTPVLWPDFGEAEFLEALTWYQQRQRRFGRRV